jgi:hypothetical protein
MSGLLQNSWQHLQERQHVWAAAEQLAGRQFYNHEELEMVDGKWLRRQ